MVAVLAVFSTLNLALRLPSRARIAEAFEQAGRRSDFEAFVAVRPDYLLATAVLRSVVTVLLLLIAMHYVGPSSAVGEAVTLIPVFAVTLGLVLVFGVAVPSAWAKYAGDLLIVRCLPLLSGVRLLCYPIIVLLNLFDPLIRRLAGVPVRDAESYRDELEQEILDVVSEGERHGAVDEAEKEMIESVIELSDTRVNEVMTPRTEIVAIPKDDDLDAVPPVNEISSPYIRRRYGVV